MVSMAFFEIRINQYIFRTKITETFEVIPSYSSIVISFTGIAHVKKAPLVWSCCKTSRRWAVPQLSPSHADSHVAQTSWRPTEDIGNHDQGWPGTTFRTAHPWPCSDTLWNFISSAPNYSCFWLTKSSDFMLDLKKKKHKLIIFKRRDKTSKTAELHIY